MKNPILEHHIGAGNCDGTVTGFLQSRCSIFHSASTRSPVDYAAIYKLLATIAVNSPPDCDPALKSLMTQISNLEYFTKKAGEDLGEAELTMLTLQKFFQKIIPAVDEALGIKKQ